MKDSTRNILWSDDLIRSCDNRKTFVTRSIPIRNVWGYILLDPRFNYALTKSITERGKAGDDVATLVVAYYEVYTRVNRRGRGT
ncbi:hypothetical protein AFLA_006632 [Aspergillus flavus NRRL3357]|nr:hypothetical protein AFLA_006632 [Aspergillus flavus NRRL3357]